MNRATGWFTVAGGAALVANKETRELGERFEAGASGFWVLIATLTLASFLNVTIRRWRLQREIKGSGF